MNLDPSYPVLYFILPDGSQSTVTVKKLLNAGYTGKNKSEVQSHIDELAELGIPTPNTTPTLYSISPYLAQQTETVYVQHEQTSGEAEWAIIIDDEGRELLTSACDHTDRKLETFGVGWSKNMYPDVIGSRAWPLHDVEQRLEKIIIKGWVGTNREIIQEAPVTALLDPPYWIEFLESHGEKNPGTILTSGTITMKKIDGLNQFSNVWGASLGDELLGTISVEYRVSQMQDAIE